MFVCASKSWVCSSGCVFGLLRTSSIESSQARIKLQKKLLHLYHTESPLQVPLHDVRCTIRSEPAARRRKAGCQLVDHEAWRYTCSTFNNVRGRDHSCKELVDTSNSKEKRVLG